MFVYTEYFEIEAKGFCDIIEITGHTREILRKTQVRNGLVFLHSPGSTCGITSIEYESGVIKDLKDFFEKIIPQGIDYAHHERWHDGNGFSHIRSALLKPNFSFPAVDGEIVLGIWQQIVFIDFDNSPRTRKIYVQVLGEQ